MRETQLNAIVRQIVLGFVAAKQRVLFAGDVVVNRFFPIMPDTDANGGNWIRILDEMEKLKPATIVPGHGAAGDASLIGAMRDYLAGVRTRVGEMQRRGASVEKIDATLIPELRAKYHTWDNPEWIRSITFTASANTSEQAGPRSL